MAYRSEVFEADHDTAELAHLVEVSNLLGLRGWVRPFFGKLRGKLIYPGTGTNIRCTARALYCLSDLKLLASGTLLNPATLRRFGGFRIVNAADILLSRMWMVADYSR